MLAGEIRVEVALRDFGAGRDIERADAGIALFGERLERGAENARNGVVGCFHGFKNLLALVPRRTIPYEGTGGNHPLYTEAPMSVAKTTSAPPPKAAWLIVSLLFLFMLVNFADKAVIGIAAVPIMKELQLSPRQFGLLGSSFYLLFAVSAVVTGFIVNRVQTRWALLVMGLVWALTQFPMIGTVGFATIAACRIALGEIILEGRRRVALPCPQHGPPDI